MVLLNFSFCSIHIVLTGLWSLLCTDGENKWKTPQPPPSIQWVPGGQRCTGTMHSALHGAAKSSRARDQGLYCTGLWPHTKGQTTWKAGCCFPEMPGEQLLCLEDSPQHHFPVVPSGRRATPPRHRDIAFQVPLASKTDVRKLSLHRCCFTSTCRCCSLCRVQSSLVLQPGYHPSQVEEIINLF